jgi:hypothetical protein
MTIILINLCVILLSLTKIVTFITKNFFNTENVRELIKRFSAADGFIERQERMNMYKRIRLGLLETLSIAFHTLTILYCAAVCCVHTHSPVLELVKFRWEIYFTRWM